MKISACYIVKNEEKTLGRSLESIRGQVDEIIVVDTGSEDRTMAVAKEYGAMVYQQPWEQDFAKVRNFALSKADGDWLILLDGDEYFTAETCQNIRSLLEHNSQFDGFVIKLVNINIDNSQSGNVAGEATGEVIDSLYQLRIVKNQPGLAYVGRIHEELRLQGKAIGNLAKVPPQQLEIYHTGYSQENLVAKGQRNLAILQAEIAAGRPEQELYRYLFECYNGMGNYMMAEHYAWLDVALPRQKITYGSQCYRYLLKLLASKKDMASAQKRLKLAGETVAKYPEVPDFHAEYGAALAWWYRYSEAAEELQEAAKLYQNYNGLEPCLLDDTAIASIQQEAGKMAQLAQQAEALKISACVIVRNEGANIKAWLDNASVYADEIILADTGSQDNTIAIAQDWAAASADRQGKLNIYHYQWQDDFAAAKNFALAKAPGDWIIFLDADETFAEPKSVRGYLAAITDRQEQLVMLPMEHIDKDNHNRVISTTNLARALRNHLGLKYIGKIHEQLSLNGRDDQGISYQLADYRLTIEHTGYSQSIVKSKLRRNLQLLDKAISESSEPQKYYYYLADCFFGLGQYQYALDNALLAIQSDYQPIGQQGDMYYLALQSMEELEYSYEDMLAVAEAGKAAVSILPDFYGYAGLIYQAMGNTAAAKENFLRALAMDDEKKQLQSVSAESTHFQQLWPRVMCGLAQCRMAGNDKDAARACYFAVLQENKWQEKALAGYLDTYDIGETMPEAVIDNLKKLYFVDGNEVKKLQEIMALQGFYPWSKAIGEVAGMNQMTGPAAKWYNQLADGKPDGKEKQETDYSGELQYLLNQQKILFAALLSAQVDFTAAMYKQQLQLLTPGMQAIVLVYHNSIAQGESQLKPQQWSDYQAMLPAVLRTNNKAVQANYISLLEPMADEQKLQVVKTLLEMDKPDKMDLVVNIYGMVTPEVIETNKDYWSTCGKLFYQQGHSQQALDCFAKAKSLGYSGRDIETFTGWCHEDLH
ncbi:MAG: glycosyltransferase [Selenomonadaceae bacterium]|nr:glycosyltransferase [Selenomonadaceae bacterium]